MGLGIGVGWGRVGFGVEVPPPPGKLAVGPHHARPLERAALSAPAGSDGNAAATAAERP